MVQWWVLFIVSTPAFNFETIYYKPEFLLQSIFLKLWSFSLNLCRAFGRLKILQMMMWRFFRARFIPLRGLIRIQAFVYCLTSNCPSSGITVRRDLPSGWPHHLHFLQTSILNSSIENKWRHWTTSHSNLERHGWASWGLSCRFRMSEPLGNNYEVKHLDSVIAKSETFSHEEVWFITDHFH